MQLGMTPLGALRSATADALALLGLVDAASEPQAEATPAESEPASLLAAGATADLCAWSIVGTPIDLAATLRARPALVLRAGRPVAGQSPSEKSPPAA